jgi:hypothetical protein
MTALETTPMDSAIATLEAAFVTEHPEFDRASHKAEVDSGDTRLWNYWEWVVHQIESGGETVEEAVKNSNNTGRHECGLEITYCESCDCEMEVGQVGRCGDCETQHSH